MKVRYGKIIIITDAYFDGQHIFFFFQAEDGIRDKLVTGVQTCALPILTAAVPPLMAMARAPGRALTVPKVVRTPEVPSMPYIVTSLESSPDTYKNFPEGSTVSQAGSIPVANGEPATSLRAPVAAFQG